MTDTKQALEAVVGLVGKATPGEWQSKNEIEWEEIVGDIDGPDDGQMRWTKVCEIDVYESTDAESRANAAAIIAAVNLIRTHGPALLAALDQVAQLQAALGEAERQWQAAQGVMFNVYDNLNDMPISDEWAADTARKLNDLLAIDAMAAGGGEHG